MKYTDNYGLKKPETNDYIEIDDLNENADIIDDKLKEHENELDSKETPAGAQAKADQAEQNAKAHADQVAQTAESNAKQYTDEQLENYDGTVTWEDIENKPEQFPPVPHNHSISDVDGLQNELDSKETPAGAQAKADQAEQNAKQYADGQITDAIGDVNIPQLELEVDNLKQSGLDGKNQLETAIESKGGTVSKTGDVATFDELESGIISIPQAKGNATRADVLSGKTFSSEEAGIEVTGTMTNRGAVSRTIQLGSSYTIPEGYHNGSGRVRAESDNIIILEGFYSGLNYTAHEGDFSLSGVRLSLSPYSIVTSTSTVRLNNVETLFVVQRSLGTTYFGVCTSSQRSGSGSSSFTAYKSTRYTSSGRERIDSLDVSDLTGSYYLKFTTNTDDDADFLVVLLR